MKKKTFVSFEKKYTMRSFIAIGLGGAIGSVLRYIVSLLTSRSAESSFPWSTFMVNIIGCFLMGILFSISEKYAWFSNDMRLFFITGFCGGLTTFSAFALENWKYVQQGQMFLFLWYSLVSVVSTLLAVWIGVWIFKMIG